jgi:hypothetical protein
MSRAPHPIYNDGWAEGVAFVNAELAKRERPVRWARAEIAKLRKSTPTGLRDDFGWGFKDGASVTLANFLYRVDNFAEHL